MSLWAVTMVRDELDILPYTLRHLVGEGVDGFVIADNLSSDGTWEWLSSASLGVQVLLVRDEEPGYYQSRKMTGLYRMAVSLGAHWVVPFDADELWFNPAGFRLREIVARGWDADCLEAAVFNYHPTSQDAPEEPNPFRRIVHRDPQPTPLKKVLVRAAADVTIEQGNHKASASHDLVVVPGPIAVAHFPWRGCERFERKIRNGLAAYAASDLPTDWAEHWRYFGRILDEGGPEALRAAYFRHFHDVSGLEICVAPWRG